MIAVAAGTSGDRHNARSVYLKGAKTGTTFGVFAFGELTDSGKIVVHEGAVAAYEEQGSIPLHSRDLRRRLLVEGVWVPVGTSFYRQTRHCKFDSVSSAANALLGGSENGHRRWRFLSTGEPIG